MSWGEIYNTSWWGVALDTARTVKARPDFFGSQLNLLTSEQPNLITNGTFDTDSDWAKDSGWTISGGSANCDGTDGAMIRTINTPLTEGKKYYISYEITDYNSGIIRLLGQAFYGITGNSVSTVTGIFVATVPYLRFYSSAFNGSIDNVSVQVARAELDQIEAKKCLADWIHTTALKDLNN